MRTALVSLWEKLHTTMWFLPSVVTLGAAALFVLIHTGDVSLRDHLPPWLLIRSADHAARVVAALVQAVIGVAGITFSITMAALMMASSQYGPRLLRNFMADNGNQIVLGIFIGTAVFGGMVLRTLGKNGPLPHLSVNAALVLGLASLGALTYFIHHLAQSIHVDNLATSVLHDMQRTVYRILPDADDHHRSRADIGDIPSDLEQRSAEVHLSRGGYVKSINLTVLSGLAEKHDVIIALTIRPGDFLVPGHVIARVYPAERASAKLSRRIGGHCSLGRQRTTEQDLVFSIHELIEIALRGLSPALNDPFIAMGCIDRLMQGLALVAQRDRPTPYHYDDEGKLRLITRPFVFVELVELTVGLLLHDAKTKPFILAHLLRGLSVVGQHVWRAEDREALRRQAERLSRIGEEVVHEPADRELIDAAWRSTTKHLGAAPGFNAQS